MKTYAYTARASWSLLYVAYCKQVTNLVKIWLYISRSGGSGPQRGVDSRGRCASTLSTFELLLTRSSLVAGQKAQTALSFCLRSAEYSQLQLSWGQWSEASRQHAALWRYYEATCSHLIVQWCAGKMTKNVGVTCNHPMFCLLPQAAVSGLEAGGLQRQAHMISHSSCAEIKGAATALQMHVHVHCAQIEVDLTPHMNTQSLQASRLCADRTLRIPSIQTALGSL